MISRVAIAAIDKGQWLASLGFFILLILILRLPEDSLLVITNKLLDLISRMSILGWILWIVTLFVAFLKSKGTNEIHNKEVERLSQEKRFLQEKLIGNLPSSSDPNERIIIFKQEEEK